MWVLLLFIVSGASAQSLCTESGPGFESLPEKTQLSIYDFLLELVRVEQLKKQVAQLKSQEICLELRDEFIKRLQADFDFLDPAELKVVEPPLTELIPVPRVPIAFDCDFLETPPPDATALDYTGPAPRYQAFCREHRKVDFNKSLKKVKREYRLRSKSMERTLTPILHKYTTNELLLWV